MKNSQIKKRTYLLLFLGILGIEIIIATVFKGNFIRHTVGDFFIVILLYLMVRILTNIGWMKAALCVFLFSCFVEFLQWVNLLEVLGLQRNLTTDLTIGSTFDWKDIFAYSTGILFVVFLECLEINRRTKKDGMKL